jgi:hypothetical protein
MEHHSAINLEKMKSVICSKIDGTEKHHFEQNKQDTKRQVSHILSLSHMWELQKNQPEIKIMIIRHWEKKEQRWKKSVWI